MKNILESFAVLVVGVLSILIVYLIVQYNMIEDKGIKNIDYSKIEKIQVSDDLDDDDDDLDDEEDDPEV